MRRPLFAVCLCLVAAAALRLSFFHTPDTGGGQSFLPAADGEEITVTGRVSEKDTKEFMIESVVLFSGAQSESLSDAADSRQTIPIKEKIICKWGSSLKLRLGSTVMLTGTFEPFLAATNPGEFDTAAYYETLGICGRITDVTRLEQSGGYSRWREKLYQLRTYFKDRLYHVFPQKEASVLTAMLLGDKEELDDGIKKLYKENGIVHILSISGLHITMIGMGIYRLFRRAGAPVWAAAVCGGVFLLLYGVMTGMSLSACRAIGMYLIRMLAAVTGRSYDMLTALGVMAAVMVWNHPQYLKNAGFLLSFGSILGVGWLYPALQPEEIRFVPKRYEERRWKRAWDKLCHKMRTGMLQSILAGGSITLVTLPIQLWFYYEMPTYSILLNLLVLPFMGIVMGTGLVTMLLPGTGLVGTITCLILRGYEWICECFHRLPFHTWNPGRPQMWQVAVYYLLLLLLVVIQNKKKQRKSGGSSKGSGEDKRILRQMLRYLHIPLILTLAVTIFALRMRAGHTVTFLDVGQGDSIVVELSSGEVYLFDCGSSSRKKTGEYVLMPYLKYRGIHSIDAVFVSHPDEDHCNGIEELFALGEEEGITVGQLVLPWLADTMREELTSLIQEAGEAAQKEPVRISYIKAGDFFATEDASFLCLHPPEAYGGGSTNACSQCFYIELYGSKGSAGQGNTVSLLLTGDVEGEGEALLLQELKNRSIGNVTVLKVAHHGSKNATCKKILEQLKPGAAVISCGKNNSYGHPHTETLERLNEVNSKVMVTKEHGAIIVQIRNGVNIRSYVRTRLTLLRSSYHSSVRF